MSVLLKSDICDLPDCLRETLPMIELLLMHPCRRGWQSQCRTRVLGFTLLTLVEHCSCLRSLNPGICDPVWNSIQAGIGPQAACVANGCACSCHHMNGGMQENQGFGKPVFWRFFRTFPLLKELMFQGQLMRISQRKLDFCFKGQNYQFF